MIVRKRLVFRGSVQGVGFRYRARYAAAAQGCTGWCRNDWDGSVTMEIQGEPEQIDRVILSIQNGRWVEIRGMEARSLPVIEGERGFRAE